MKELLKAKFAEFVGTPGPGEDEAVEAGDGSPTEILGPLGAVDAKPPDSTASAEMRSFQAGHVGVPLGVPVHPEVRHLDQSRSARTEVNVDGGSLETLDSGQQASDRHRSACFVRPRQLHQKHHEDHDHQDAVQPHHRHADITDTSVGPRRPIEAAAITRLRAMGRRWEGQAPAPSHSLRREGPTGRPQ